MYPTVEAVRMENKFAPCPMKLPIVEDPQKCMITVKKQTGKLRNAFPALFFVYNFAKFMALVMPDWLSAFLQGDMSNRFTLAFSNTPGILRPIFFKESEVKNLASLVGPTAKTGISISVMSMCDRLQISSVTDTSLLTKSQ